MNSLVGKEPLPFFRRFAAAPAGPPNTHTQKVDEHKLPTVEHTTTVKLNKPQLHTGIGSLKKVSTQVYIKHIFLCTENMFLLID